MILPWSSNFDLENTLVYPGISTQHLWICVRLPEICFNSTNSTANALTVD